MLLVALVIEGGERIYRALFVNCVHRCHWRLTLLRSTLLKVGGMRRGQSPVGLVVWLVLQATPLAR